jgi:hypothetical protein
VRPSTECDLRSYVSRSSSNVAPSIKTSGSQLEK